MYQYKIKFYVNGSESETIIGANTTYEAEKILRAQYPGSNLSIRSTNRL